MQTTQSINRLRLHIHGAAQGVGFRPFVYRLATELQLTGWVNNTVQGVFIEVEGAQQCLEQFVSRIEREKPAHALIRHVEIRYLEPAGYTKFEIKHSDGDGTKTAFVLPDIATCPDCLAEIFDPLNRRYLYPFTNCTNCGPRFTIIEALPYDRPQTTMKHFAMCPSCQAEYDNPLDRRFHAQPNACPQCGPHLELWSDEGEPVATHHNTILAAAAAIRAGQIVAVKGLGGFHLMIDASNQQAVQALRERKQRPEKPFALMYPSLAAIQSDCVLSEVEKQVLTSAAAPIVLLRRKQDNRIVPAVAPDNPYLGVMLPYTPLHHILLRALDGPIVATSGNLSDEPICIDEYEALQRLQHVADLFFIHNRPIVRHADDSVVQVVADEAQMLRRARGYAPLPLHIQEALPPALAVGAHQKSALAVAIDHEVFISQHIGDLETAQAVDAFEGTAHDLQQLYDLHPQAVACDSHPDYHSTKFASQMNLPFYSVQHHEAHVLSCMADNNIQPPVLGVAWDGTGYGSDGTIWGGEFLLVDAHSIQRVAHLRPFRLPGGAQAVREPRRTAFGLMYEIFGEAVLAMNTDALNAFQSTERAALLSMLKCELNTPITTSAGRLFDAVAALIGLRQCSSYEGQAAMQLEYSIQQDVMTAYPFVISQSDSGMWILDWEPMIRRILEDVSQSAATGTIAAKFHNTLIEMILAAARLQKIERVVLSGGCFQNRYLIEQAIIRLYETGFVPCWHHQVPPNDGGLVLGQMMALVRQFN